MSDSEQDKSKSPFDSETEDETIALSKDELNNILSSAEIVQEKAKQEEVEQNSESLEGDIEAEEESISTENIEENPEPESNSAEEDEFDISGEIDELSPEDLENIELEEGDIENYTHELETELGEELEMPAIEEGSLEGEESLEDIENELGDIDTEGITLEANLDDEEMDLDTYLESVKADIDLETMDEAGEEGLEESPVIGDMEDIDTFEKDAEEAFKEAGIEGIGDEFEDSGEQKGDEDLLKGLEADVTLTEEETGEIPQGSDEISISDEAEVEIAEGLEADLADKQLEGEIDLTDEEEGILGEDLDLAAEEPESEGVVTVSGEDLDKIAVEAEGTEESAPHGIDEAVIDKTLFNDITVILKYMDNLLGELPEDKIKEFSQSKYFSLYKEVFEKLNLAE
jgi:hypothetical protein